MNEDVLREQLETARQAEDFLKYIEENPYMKTLLERMKLQLAQWLLVLPPDAKEQFASLKTRYDFIDEFLNAVRGDIAVGSSALDKLNGKTDENKGLL